MAAFRGPKVWLWRWRRNPLRRPVDALEAWVVLVAWTLTVLCGVLAGLAAAQSVDNGLARERAEWHPIQALLSEDASRSPGPAASGAGQVWAPVRWTATDGSAHAGQARVKPGSAAGTPVTVSQARLRASLVGFLVGVSAASIPFVGGRLVRGRLERRRMAHWDEEWQRFGPRWGSTTG
jgi:hypothetical protein